eukprot:2505889-Prymnesium_polylepis.1
MYGMVSGEGEKVMFTEPPVAEGAVEQWLLRVEMSMRGTLYDNCKLCLQKLPKPEEGWLVRDAWYFGYAAASVLMIGQIEWTADVTVVPEQTAAGDKEALTVYNTQWIEMIDSMVQIVRRQLTPNERQVVGAKLVIDVHARDT